jgi:hypothetical protein
MFFTTNFFFLNRLAFEVCLFYICGVSFLLKTLCLVFGVFDANFRWGWGVTAIILSVGRGPFGVFGI